MKKLLRVTIIDLRKTLVSYGTVVCIAAVFLLCFASTIYTDGFTGKEYTVLEVIADRNKLPQIGLSPLDIVRSSVNPYLTLFLPVLSSIPFVTLFCAERLSGNIRFIITRTGKLTYALSKFFSAVISGALTVTIGFIMYSLVIFVVFGRDGALSDLIRIYTGTAIYGAVSVLPAFLLSSFIRNKYMICCFPFIFMHFYYTVLAKLQDHYIDNWKVILKINMLYTSNIKDIFFTHDKSTVMLYTVLTVAVFAVYTLIMNRRLDNGQ